MKEWREDQVGDGRNGGTSIRDREWGSDGSDVGSQYCQKWVLRVAIATGDREAPGY